MDGRVVERGGVDLAERLEAGGFDEFRDAESVEAESVEADSGASA